MSPKNTFAILIILIAAIFFYSFVYAFKVEAVNDLSLELTNLQTAYANAANELSLRDLRLKKSQLTSQNMQVLENFVPQSLHSGVFVYNLAQLANQSGLSMRSIQYIVIDETANNPNGEKRLQVEFTMDGRYENFSGWLRSVEYANVLVDVESIRAAKTSNTNDNIAFTVKMYAYGLNID